MREFACGDEWQKNGDLHSSLCPNKRGVRVIIEGVYHYSVFKEIPIANILPFLGNQRDMTYASNKVYLLKQVKRL